ncbi:MAG: signal peptide peptidase SppA [Thermodesulfobacteriota bacterium]
MRTVLITIILLIVLFFTFMAGVGSGLLLSGMDGISPGDKVAVLKIEGVILDSQIYLESIKKIKEDDNFKAVVVRIDSPGGAVAPSQEIYEELKSLNETIPVISSIGTVGASGGYYIAVGTQKIYANPGSITGSIGVIAQFVNYGQLLDWAKVDVEVIKSGQYKDVGSPFREMNEADREYIQELIDNVYDQFRQAVSDARDIKEPELDLISDGKIFTGEQAKKLKLIDEIGSISDAISEAGKLGGLGEEPDVIYFPKKRSQLLELLFSKTNLGELTKFPIKVKFGLYYLTNL